jgi:hypothetical protein
VNGTGGSASAVSAGDYHTCAVQSGSGTLVCWGQLGGAPSSIHAELVASGELHICWTGDAGEVACDGYLGPYDYGQTDPPDSVDGTDGTALAIALGDYHSCAIRTDNRGVVCWGLNEAGQATPPPTVNGVWGKADAVSAGSYQTLAIRHTVAAPNVPSLSPSGVALGGSLLLLTGVYAVRRSRA